MRYNIFILFIMFVVSSCSPSQRINSIIAKNPHLKSIVKATVITHDTSYVEEVYTVADTQTTKREIIDSSMYYRLDSMYKVQEGNINAMFEFTRENGNNKVNFVIEKQPEYLYFYDTIRHVDTIVNTIREVTTREIINTTPSFWWNLWRTSKWWITLIIIAGIAAYFYNRRNKK